MIVEQERNRWTIASIMCYERGCVCEGCKYRECLESECKMKESVLGLVREVGVPRDENIRDLLSGRYSRSELREWIDREKGLIK